MFEIFFDGARHEVLCQFCGTFGLNTCVRFWIETPCVGL
jgi:hypothetical protein